MIRTVKRVWFCTLAVAAALLFAAAQRAQAANPPMLQTLSSITFHLDEDESIIYRDGHDIPSWVSFRSQYHPKIYLSKMEWQKQNADGSWSAPTGWMFTPGAWRCYVTLTVDERSSYRLDYQDLNLSVDSIGRQWTYVDGGSMKPRYLSHEMQVLEPEVIREIRVTTNLNPSVFCAGHWIPNEDMEFHFDEAIERDQVSLRYWHFAKADAGTNWYDLPMAEGNFAPGRYYLVMEWMTGNTDYKVSPATKVYLDGKLLSQYVFNPRDSGSEHYAWANTSVFAAAFDVSAEPGSVNGVLYAIDASNPKTAYAYGYRADLLPAKLKLNETVTFSGNAYPVTRMKNTFENCDILTSVSIPKSVTRMENAFLNAKNLNTITFAPGSKLTTVGSCSFAGCGKLTQLALPKSVQTVGSYACKGCKALRAVAFSKGSKVQSIGKYAFGYDTGKAPITLYYWPTDTATAKAVKGYVTWAKKQGLTNVRAVAIQDLSKCKIAKIADQTCTGKAVTPALTITCGKTKLKKGADYTLSWKNNTAIGPAAVTVVGKGAYVGTKKAAFRIVPAKVTGLTLRAGRTQLAVKYKLVKGGVRYQVAVRPKGGRKWAASDTAKTSVTMKKLRSKTIYYVKVRAYKKVGKRIYYGPWSATKSARVK